MATQFECDQLLQVITSLATALSSASTGATTTALGASIAAQIAADTGLGATAKAMLGAIRVAIGSATPVSSILNSSNL